MWYLQGSFLLLDENVLGWLEQSLVLLLYWQAPRPCLAKKSRNKSDI
ncbi:hypothetical protein NC651_029830 [Populus alba x Populus x berolinensis]|nr:hypothetical protein NC651_029830 [Populus alba x Populus x berolinensis]